MSSKQQKLAKLEVRLVMKRDGCCALGPDKFKTRYSLRLYLPVRRIAPTPAYGRQTSWERARRRPDVRGGVAGTGTSGRAVMVVGHFDGALGFSVRGPKVETLPLSVDPAAVCCMSIFCSWCVSYHLRKRALHNDMTR